MSEPIIKEYREITTRVSRVCQICKKQFPNGSRMIRKKFQGNINNINFVCLPCESKIRPVEIKTNKRFHVGDRVKYRANGTGNSDLNGMIGTVIYVDSRDYTVEFGSEIYDGITDYRAREIGIEPKFERGWFCREEHLEAEA